MIVALLATVLGLLGAGAGELRSAPGVNAYPLHAAQAEVYNSPARHRFVVYGRGGGKTHGALASLAQAVTSPYAAELGDRYEAVYVGPSYRQAKRIVWKRLKALFPRHLLAKKPHETDLQLVLKWGPTITLMGADNIDASRGQDLHFAILDEHAFYPAGVWEALEGGLRTQRDRALIITTPNGPNHAWELWQSVQGDSEWATFQAPTWANPHHDAVGLEKKRQRLARNVFDQEYGAKFEAQKGAVYSDFDQSRHLGAVELDHGAPVYVGQDFNAGHYCAVICQKRGASIVVVDEVITTTHIYDHLERLKAYLSARGVDFRRGATVFCDSSGGYNVTGRKQGSADETLFAQAGFITKHDSQNPPIIDRVHSVQSLLLSGSGEVRMVISERCRELRTAMLSQKWSQWGNRPEKAHGWDDVTDALGYAVWGLFPIRPQGFARSA